MLNTLLNNYQEAVAMILFGIGFATLLFQRNLIRKLIGMNIMDAGLFLFLTSLGYIHGHKAPILEGDKIITNIYINPVPSGLVLTGIVVSVSVTAAMLALTVRLYRRYHTLDMDEIYAMTLKEREEGDE